MPYWVFDQSGQVAAVVSEADPDLQRVLSKPQNRAPNWMPMPQAAQLAPQSQPPTQNWAQPAAAARPVKAAVAHPAQQHSDQVYRVRHVPTGKFLGAGLDPQDDKAPKTWPNRGNAKNAVAHAIRRGLGSEAEFEIVPLTLS